ncbi:MAG: DUF1801 domain-containing protein [Chloroflexota bacterium]
MDNSKKAPANVDDYIANFPENIQALLQTLRQTIHAAAPHATEILSYGMPCFRMKHNLVYFSAAKKHIGFYPTPGAIKTFQQQLSAFKGAKGSVQFPYDQPLPLDLVTEIVKYRVEQDAKA